jgi:hypothetical protein
MATDYRCPGCDLRFSTGRYHYHRIETGYGGRALLACSACGTQHAIELALPSRGPEFYAVQRLVVDSVPETALSRVAQWLRKNQKQPMGLESALQIARNPPFTLFEFTWEERAAKVESELQSLGVRLRRETVEHRPNPSYGPLQHDRLLYHSEPRFGEQRPEWLPSDQSVSNLASLECHHCHAFGALVEESPKSRQCPACRSATLVIDSTWMT